MKVRNLILIVTGILLLAVSGADASARAKKHK